MIIDGKQFKVIVNVKKIKKIYLRVKIINGEYCLVISSFKKLTSKYIEQFVNNNYDFIVNVVKKLEKNSLKNDEILILGEIYNINSNNINELLKETKLKVEQLYNYYQNIFNKTNTILKFRKMKSRWGVCHITKNYISLSTYLFHLPLYLIEYVIIHEFCHFKHPNHSKQFYLYVKNYCPDYKQRNYELKNFSYILK